MTESVVAPTPQQRSGDRWYLRVLGSVAVERLGDVIDRFPTRRSALILIRLALAQGRAVSRDALAAALWPDEFADATRPRLRQELARLRKALGEAEEIIETDRLTLRIDTQKTEIDLKVAEQVLLRSALQQDQDKKIRALEALAPYAAEIAPGYEEPWITAVREDWRNRSSQMLLEVAEACEKRGDADRAVGFGKLGAGNHLLSESIQSRFLQLLVRLDRHEEAAQYLADLDGVYTRLLGAGPTHRLAQRVWPDQRPEPRATVVRPSEPKARALPGALGQLFGRQKELERLTSVLDPSSPARLVTVSGPGGIGKTQLSLEVGRKLAPSYRKRVWFVALAEVAEPSRIGKLILDALGISAMEEDTIEAAAAALAGSPALMILDNFEQLVDGGAQVVRRMLEACPQLKLLVTTRRKLNVEGEQEIPVGSLPLAAAVDLFQSVARATRASFEAGPAELQKMADIVTLLDRMPLAIHLAASRMSVLTLSEIESQLTTRFDLLVSRRSDLEPRHRTLRQTVAWSYEQLRPELKRFFVDLSLFRGGCTVSLVQQVTGEARALEYLEELCENSLVLGEPSGGQMRFTMLVTLREFAQEKQDPKRLAALTRKLCKALLDLALEASKHILGIDQMTWYERLNREQENITVALRFAAESEHKLGLGLCAGLWRFWSVRGHHVEAREWFERLLQRELQDSIEASRALFGAARCMADQGDTNAAVEWYERTREVTERVGNHNFVAVINTNLADVYMARSEFENVLELVQRGIDSALSWNDTYFEGITRDEMALALLGHGRFEEALQESAKAQRLLEGHADRVALAYSFGTTGRCLQAAGRFDEADMWLSSAADIHRQFSNKHGTGQACEYLARSAVERGALDEAERLLDESSESRTFIGDRLGIAQVHQVRCELECRRGNRKLATQYATEARRLFRICGCDRLADACSVDLAHVC